MSSKLCRACGVLLHEMYVEQDVEYHPMCDPEFINEERNGELRGQLTALIGYAEQNAARSLQVEIGPSEIGHACDQFIARRVAGMPKVNNRSDAWPRIVGTAVHRWMDLAIQAHKNSVDVPGVSRWMPEMELPIDQMILGHSDLYTGQDVVDWKTVSTRDNIAKIKKDGPSQQHRVQAHTYGLGHHVAGRPVRDIVIAYMPRAGRIRDFYFWREPFDLRIARDAVNRVYRIGRQLLNSGVLDDPKLWAQVPMAPGPDCWFCPFNSRSLSSDDGPGESGCPGMNGTTEQMREDAKTSGFKGIL